MNLVSGKGNIVFLCKDTKIDKSEKINLILSPEFYWVRIFDLPVKSISQAKGIMPTLFEDISENVGELSYQILKLEDGRFLCFAYENKKIFDTIKNSGLNLSLVNSVYFAQNECKEMNYFKADKKGFSYTQDGILVKVPLSFLEEPKEINELIQNINLSSNKVDIKLYNNLVGSKHIYVIAVICILFTVINIFKIFDYSKEISNLDNKISKIRTNSKMPSSMLQTNSIIKKYTRNVKVERKKREAIEYILKQEQFVLNSFELDKEIVSLDFQNSDKQSIENYISSKYKIISSKVKGLDLNIRIKI